jgi:DNA-binding CsgD family transcriptional regulator
VIEGLSSSQIAKRFGRSANTIRNQTRRVYHTLGVRSRSALVVRALALGVLEPGRPPDA